MIAYNYIVFFRVTKFRLIGQVKCLTKIINETKSKLKRYLKEYNKIVIFDCDNLKDKEILDRFLLYVSKSGIFKSILIIAAECSNSEIINLDCKIDIIIFSQQELEAFFEVYNMYEFSDKFTLVTNKCQYPSLLNYMSTGLLTENEFFQALMR